MQPDVFTGDWASNSIRQIRVVFGFVLESDWGHHDDISTFIEFLIFEQMANPDVKVEWRMPEAKPVYKR